jgi:hypothetical protein
MQSLHGSFASHMLLWAGHLRSSILSRNRFGPQNRLLRTDFLDASRELHTLAKLVVQDKIWSNLVKTNGIVYS